MNSEHALRFEVKSRSLKERLIFQSSVLQTCSFLGFVCNNSTIIWGFRKVGAIPWKHIESNFTTILTQRRSFPCENTPTIGAKTVMSHPPPYTMAVMCGGHYFKLQLCLSQSWHLFKAGQQAARTESRAASDISCFQMGRC